MENNLEILNKWSKSLSKYKALKLYEAKELYQKLMSTADEDLRKEYKHELIMGTLHSVPRFIENNGLIYLNSSLYDMNDIIAVCNEIWIDKVNSGKLLEVDYYKEMFDSSYFSRLSDDLGITRFSIANNTILDANIFADLFEVYMKLKENNTNVDFTEVLDCVKDDPKYEKLFQRFHLYDYTVNVCELFDAIIESFKLGDNDLKLSKTNFDKLKYIFISNGLERLRGNMTNLATKDPTVRY